MKKIICLAISIVLVVGLFAGCGKKKDDGSEKVKLRWMIGWSSQQDTDKVMKYFNEKLEKVLPNTEVEVFSCDDAAFALKMAAKESIDISWTGFSHDMATEIANGYYLDLNDLINDYAPAVKEEMKKFVVEYDSATVDGSLYALPIQQPIVHQTSFFKIPAKFAKYLDTDALLNECHNNYFATEKLYQIIDDYFQNLIKAGVMDNTGFYTRDIFNSIARRGYDFVESSESGAWLCYDAHSDNPQIVNFCTTDQAKLFFKYAAKWYKEGIIPTDILTATDTAPADALVIALASESECWYKPDEERGVRYIKDSNTGEVKYNSYLLDDYDNLFCGSSIIGSMRTYNAIPFTCKNPERAMKFLNMLRSNTDETNELLNILVYGIEGEDYTKEKSADGDYIAHGNGYVEQSTASSLYGVPHWKVSNAFLPYRTPNILDGQKEWAYDYLTNVVPNEIFKTKLYKFKPNLADQYSYELSQLSQVSSEYMQILYDGIMGDGWEATYKEFMDKLSAAGIDNIIKVANDKAQEFIKK